LSCCPRNPHGHERALKEEKNMTKNHQMAFFRPKIGNTVDSGQKSVFSSKTKQKNEDEVLIHANLF